MSFIINSSDRILVAAALPEDLAVACGGFVCKYKNQIDIFCVNGENTQQDLYKKFYDLAQKANVKKVITNQSDYSEIDEYDIVLIPYGEGDKSEHQILTDTLIKTFLEKQGCKENLQILKYENSKPIKDANYYEDITDFVNLKKQLIMSSKTTASAYFADGVLTDNKFRTFTSYLSGKAEYVEAFFVDDLSSYLEKPDIIDKNTDKDFANEEIESFLKTNNAQNKINELSEQYSNKKIAIYGANDFSRCVFKNYDLSKLNIIAIADKRFEQNRKHEFYGINCIRPQDLVNVGADILLIAEREFVRAYDYLTKVILKDYDIEIAPLIKTDLSSFISTNTEGKICTRPFHTLSIFPTGHCITCCPAYINNFAIGSVFENNFSDIWNGKRAKYLRNSLKKSDYTICDLNTCITTELNDIAKLSEYYEENSDNVKLPETVAMNWDYDCNVACITCRNQIIKNDEESLKKLQVIEKNVLEACKTAKYFYASGNGDPFGSTHARSVIKQVTQINPKIKFIIHTNGILCTQNICDELNITDKIKDVIISIHAAHKETYDKIVRYGNFERVLQNLEWLSSAKKNGKIESIMLVFVVHKLNYKDMPDFVRMAEKYSAIASFRYYRQWAQNTEYKYEDMAVFEKTHPEYSKFVQVLQDDVFDSQNCTMDPNLKAIRIAGNAG